MEVFILNYKQIDYLKALCIISVILLHTLSIKTLYTSLAVFHIWNAVPIFMLLMSFTSAISFNKKNLNLRELYSKNYFIKKFKRILLPLTPVFIITLIYGIISKASLNLGVQNFIGVMPLSGPGNYYISILFQFIILSPLFYYLYKRLNTLSLFIALIINILFELFIKIAFPNIIYLYSASIFRYIFLLFLGYYLYDLIKQKNSIPYFFYPGLAISIIYLFIVNNDHTFLKIFLSSWKTQLFIGNFYPFILTFIGLKYLNFNSNILVEIGKASYHIFLTQIVYFIVNISNKITLNISLQLMINTVVCITIGYAFYKLDKYNYYVMDK